MVNDALRDANDIPSLVNIVKLIRIMFMCSIASDIVLY